MSDRLYLDHAATTPVLPEAREAMAEALARWANPSSPHGEGRAARSALERARADIADALGWRHDVVLTSGATEAISIAATRAALSGRMRGATEHDAVIAAMGEEAAILPVDADGLIDPNAIAGGALVAIQQVNNETGVIQPLPEIVSKVGEAQSLLLADCAQGAGKLPLPDADFISVSAHKLGGPPGIGALLVKDLATLSAGGGQERGYRRGTENLPAAAGFAAALRSRHFADNVERLRSLRKSLEQNIVLEGGIVVAQDAERSPFIGAYAMPGTASTAQLVQLDLAGIAVSAGSACSSGSMKASHVHQGMGLPAEIASSTIRVSFGPDTGQEDLERFLVEWRQIKSRAAAA